MEQASRCDPADVYAISMGGGSRVRVDEPAPPRRQLEPCVGLMGYDPEASKRDRVARGW